MPDRKVDACQTGSVVELVTGMITTAFSRIKESLPDPIGGVPRGYLKGASIGGGTIILDVGFEPFALTEGLGQTRPMVAHPHIVTARPIGVSNWDPLLKAEVYFGWNEDGQPVPSRVELGNYFFGTHTVGFKPERLGGCLVVDEDRTVLEFAKATAGSRS